MAKQTFSVGQVLSAAQMTSLMQTAMLGGAASAKTASYILVAGDAGTAITMNNAGSTTITVNTGLFADGDIVTIVNIGAGACTITAGTATVATSGSLVLAQNQGGVLRFTSASAAIFLQFATPESGDITAVTAGTGISGGGTSGAVTITNSMATEITASGDIIVGTGSGTFDNLPIGTTGQILTADTTVSPYKVKWATPASSTSKVVQIVTGSYSTQTITTSTTSVDTGLSVSITPTSASNKILVFLTQNGIGKTAANINSSIEITLLRGSTNIQTVATRMAEEDHAANTFIGFTCATTYLDSPATTSATTYKTQFRNSGGVANQVLVQTSGGASTLTLMEVTP